MIRIVGNDVVELEADPRHAEKLIEELGLQSANTVATPRVKYSDAEHAARESSPFLVGADITKYRSCTMRLKYIEQDRLDLSEAVKCLAQNMAKPRQGHMVDLKRLGRYLKGHQRAILTYRLQSSDCDLKVYTDSDWAGELATRRSTSGMVLMRGYHLLRATSTL